MIAKDGVASQLRSRSQAFIRYCTANDGRKSTPSRAAQSDVNLCWKSNFGVHAWRALALCT